MKIHPSKDIVSSRTNLLEGRRIALGICGSVGAVRSPELAREIMRHGAEVVTFMTDAAQKLISPALMEWATGNPVVTELTGGIEHVALGGGVPGCADLILIAPATANTIGKIASGIDDTAVTTLVTTGIGAGLPVILVPAMHGSMYRHPIVIENIRKLESIGVTVVPPEIAEGKAKMAGDKTIVDTIISRLTRKNLEGQRVLVTAGPTRSYIDPVRYVTNSSSGKMGIAFAREAFARGAEVSLITGPVDAHLTGVDVKSVKTTNEMLDSVKSALSSKRYDLLVMAAAPLDFSFSKASPDKIPSDSSLSLSLVPLPKIIKEARSISPDLFIIGFKAEYGLSEEELLSRAKKRLLDSSMNLIVANDLSRPGMGFEWDTDEVYVLDGNGLVEHIPMAPKREVAKKVLDIYSRGMPNVAR